MALRVARTLARISCTLYALFTIAGAVPNAAFPFNSQVPAVARVGQQYSFRISDSTFAPDPTAYVYTISNQPAWLTIDSSTRTLQGTPGASDAGSTTFVLTAADSSGNAQMSCTLVVSADPAPQPLGDIITKQLSATANLSSSQPPTLTLLPSTRFTFDFGQDSFIDVLQRKLYYYATLDDHTPLPSWMKFDPDLLTFSGTAPDLASFPQSWVISLIASDVPGFSANSASFTMTIGTQQLVFVPEEQELSITARKLVNITVLQNELFRNNVNLDSGELKSAEADIPSWLTFDPSTLAIEGTAPANFQAENVTITVTDKLGNAATAIITLVPGDSSMFHGQIGTLSAQAGKKFEYHFDDSLFTQKDLNLSVHVPSTASWLTYDATTQDLTGIPPTKSQASTVRATLVAKSASDQQGQAQSFIIRIKAATTVSIASKIPPDVEKDAGLDRVDSHLEPPTPLRAFDPPPQIVLDGIPERRSRFLKRFSPSMTLDPKRKSIRMVGRSDSIRAPGDDSRPDNRPLDKKRESFIRNRHRSGHMQSPLFSSHGSRSGSASLQRNGSQSIEASLAGSVRRAKRGTPSGWGSKSALPSQNTLLTKYSESSSLEPHGHMDSPHRDSRRFSQRLRNTFVPGFPRAITRSTLFDNHDDDRIDEDDGDSPRHSNHHHHHHHHHTNNSSIWTTSASNNTSPSDGWLVEELSKPRAERDWVLPDESSPIVLTAAPPPSLAPTSRASTPLEGAESAKSGQNWRRSRRRSRADERDISTSSPLSQPRHPHPPLQSINASSAISADTTAGSERDKRGQEQEQRQGYSLWVTDGESESESDEEEDEQEKLHGAGLIPPLGGSYHDDESERSTGKGDTARSDWTGRAFL
ncbi:uncharacterized protein SEPMUDRAFT_53722 [Sphaerulina musiva SO2202]|uniref:Dystroglycan-type cadherin-like domain-containing protein n=1 Tax=Sphaerulina musiva (strain SO2202) TaxID=692275 RepID=M3CW08_SPHMS|nr:uncharacterized protein SEPMUDRAFT_53722 [Sphaerulina musiva SO2202]EMF08322.1 hypothetical protein SEPMUDRAFT_53722 [Sphaerulina musiva SO2202]